ncbi:hypothetical protein RHMOL_Rhmol01G0228900 [Rhododendron molle]|nr:hypothetical protein RHMOL_Rhmol01G0228900 [Rhododendron molle]
MLYFHYFDQANFALAEGLQENKALKDDIAKITTKSKVEIIMNQGGVGNCNP